MQAGSRRGGAAGRVQSAADIREAALPPPPPPAVGWRPGALFRARRGGRLAPAHTEGCPGRLARHVDERHRHCALADVVPADAHADGCSVVPPLHFGMPGAGNGRQRQGRARRPGACQGRARIRGGWNARTAPAQSGRRRRLRFHGIGRRAAGPRGAGRPRGGPLRRHSPTHRRCAAMVRPPRHAGAPRRAPPADAGRRPRAASRPTPTLP